MNRPLSSIPFDVVFRANRRVGFALFAISGVVNLLTLTGAFYMLQIYDRVLSSHSVPTLVALSVLAVGLYLFQGILDVIRGQILVRLGARVDHGLMSLAHRAALRLPLFGASSTRAVQPVRDVETVRGFLGSPAVAAFLDLPWMPLYLVFVYMLHPWLGLLAMAGLLVLVGLTLLTESMTRELGGKSQKAGEMRLALAESHAHNAEVIHAMGFGTNASERFALLNLSYLAYHSKASDVGTTLGGISKVFRMVLQSAILGLGAYLTLNGQVTAGVIIAASIASSRALAPVELVIAHWRNFVAARQGYARLTELFSHMPPVPELMRLPAPRNRLQVEDISVNLPESRDAVLSNIAFELKCGEALGLIGPSASGKSSLARALTGVWPLSRGKIRLDGAGLDQWSTDGLGRHIGYLPQDVELFPGTIADNIARMEEGASSDEIIAAARAAGVHDMILRLPAGYETELGERGRSLSAGQRQRVSLARALFRDPFLVVLDEPNSNLDSEGEEALTGAINGVRNRGGIAVVIAHRPSALAAVDKVGVITSGRLSAFGERDEVLDKVLRRAVSGSGLAVVPSEGASGS